jgi:hypothetical protein
MKQKYFMCFKNNYVAYVAQWLEQNQIFFKRAGSRLW